MAIVRKVREIVRILERHGFKLDRQKGSHRRFVGVVHGRTRRVTVSGNPNDDVAKSTMASIRRQSGLPRKAFRQENSGA